MKKNLFISFVLLTGIIFVSSCGDSTSTSKSVSDAVFKDNSGVFRAYNFNDKIDKVKSQEDNTALKESDEDFLSYDYKIDDDNSYTIEFSFDEQGLYEIDILTAFTKENAEKLKNKIKAVYSPKCDNIITKDSLLTMDSKDGKYIIDVDYLDINDGIVTIKFEANE